MLKRDVFVISLSVLTLVSSCGISSLESRGDSAYQKAQRTTIPAEKRLAQKEAYMFYRRAVKKKADKSAITPHLRNRFIEMTLKRASMVLTEATAGMEALELFQKDIDTVMNESVLPDLKQDYAVFLAQIADSSLAKENVSEGMELIEKAMALAPNPSRFIEKKQGVVEKFVKDNIEMANMELENASTNNDSAALIRAEYFANAAVMYDSSNSEAQEILSTLRKKNLPVYSAYEAVIENKPDSLLYDKVNRFDILFAIPLVNYGGSTVRCVVNMFNYSYNPQRLLYENFSLVDVNGRKYTATSASRLGKDFLDQDHELKMTLVFPRPSAPIKKLVYEWKEHYAEKYFQ